MSYLGISMVTVRFFFILTKLVDMPRAIQYTVSAHTISMKSTQVFIRLHLRFSDLMGSRLNLKDYCEQRDWMPNIFWYI